MAEEKGIIELKMLEKVGEYIEANNYEDYESDILCEEKNPPKAFKLSIVAYNRG